MHKQLQRILKDSVSDDLNNHQYYIGTYKAKDELDFFLNLPTLDKVLYLALTTKPIQKTKKILTKICQYGWYLIFRLAK